MIWFRTQQPKRKWARSLADWPGINAALAGVMCLGIAWFLTVLITGRSPSEFDLGAQGNGWAELTALIFAGPFWLIGTISGLIGTISLTLYFVFWLIKLGLRRRSQRQKEES